MKSSVASRLYESSSSSMWGRSSAATAISMRTSSRCSSMWSSRSRLLASTTSAGSMKTVLPDADSSWTMPGMRRLFIGATGTTRRPSRTDAVVSWSR